MAKGKGKRSPKPYRSPIGLEDIYRLAQAFVPRHPQPRTGRGRPPRYDEARILVLWLFKQLYRLSYRRLRRLARALGYPVPEISTRRDRVARLPEQRLADFHRWLAVRRLGKAKWETLLVDGAGLGLAAPLTQVWRRGSPVRQVQAHIQVGLFNNSLWMAQTASRRATRRPFDP